MKIKMTVELDTEVASYNKTSPIKSLDEARQVYNEVLQEAFYCEGENGPVSITIEPA